MSPSPSLSILAANVPDRMEAVETEVQDIYVNISWNLPDFGSSSVTAYDLQFRVDDTTTFASILPECDGSDETIVSQRFCLAPKSKLRLIHFLDISTRASQHGLMLLLTQPERRTISKWLLSITMVKEINHRHWQFKLAQDLHNAIRLVISFSNRYQLGNVADNGGCLVTGFKIL